MDRNQVFIKDCKITDIPWHCLATAYGRATDFPQYFESLISSDMAIADKAGEQIEINIEHQSTLWPATPFAMIFLARLFVKLLSNMEQDVHRYVVVNLLDMFVNIAKSCTMGNEMEHAEPLALFEDMLKEEYLWPEEYDEDEDEARYEEDSGPFPDNLFYSFYYYSNEVLKFNKDILYEHVASADKEIAVKIKCLLLLIN